jgi:hypothetical protein
MTEQQHPVPAAASPPARSRDDAELSEHRRHLLQLEQLSQTAFDKTMVSLAGGALAISFAFVKDFLRPQPPTHVGILLAAWLCWVATLAIILTSHYFSVIAIRKAVDQIDSGKSHQQHTGGIADWVTAGLNLVSLFTFLAGLVLAGFFVHANLGA